MMQPTPSASDRSLGAQLAHAIAARDAETLTGLFSTPVTFAGVTPRRLWDADTPGGVTDIVLGTWFSPDKRITDLISVDADTVGDVAKVSYRMAVDLQTGPSVIEQVAYYDEQDGLITNIRILCSGFRPTGPATTNASMDRLGVGGGGEGPSKGVE